VRGDDFGYNVLSVSPDVNLAGYTGDAFNVIGTYYSPFIGDFDGNNHVIFNFTYTSTGLYSNGMFGSVSNGQIKNVGLVNANVNVASAYRVGSLVGLLLNSSVSNCFAVGGSVSGYYYVGGLIGDTWESKVSNCFTSVNVSGDKYVGGLMGMNEYYRGMVSNCYTTGTVTGNERVGGLVGGNWYASIYNSFSTGDVNGSVFVGGLVGSGSKGIISDCYASGAITSTGDKVGGLIGYIYNGKVIKCYSAGICSGSGDVGGLVGHDYNANSKYMKCFWDNEVNPTLSGIGNSTDPDVIGEPTVNMQMQITFVDSGWDFVGERSNGPSDKWSMPVGGGYPVLWYQMDPMPSLPTFSGGSGTALEPYIISDANDLMSIGDNYRLMDKHFVVVNDINLSGREFFMIGSVGSPFTGIFDGNDSTISNFNHTSTETDYVGMFSFIDSGGQVKRINLANADVNAGAGDYVGCLAGYNRAGSIHDCCVSSGNASGRDYVGLLVGLNKRGDLSGYYGLVSNCHVSGNASGNEVVGGLLGYNYHGSIINSSSSGSVFGNTEVGGLAGLNVEGVSGCYSSSEVTGNWRIGGLIGKSNYGTVSNCSAVGDVNCNGKYAGGLFGSCGGRVVNCYSAGAINGPISSCGGLTGFGFSKVFTRCFWDITVNPSLSGIGGGDVNSADVIGETTENMQIQSTFTDAGWDFIGETTNGLCEDWAMPAGGGYPVNWWKFDSSLELPAFSGGSGSKDDPFLVSNVNDLRSIGHNARLLDKHFLMTNDINLAGIDFPMIAGEGIAFTGTFDGGGFLVRNFSYSSTGRDDIGFFSVIGADALISNLGLVNVNVVGGTGENIGALVGCNNGATIRDCFVENGAVTGDSYIGGMVGSTKYYGQVRDSHYTGSVTGGFCVGGLVGDQLHGSIKDCHSEGFVSSSKDCIGGLVGWQRHSALVSRCYSTCTVIGDCAVGGLIGFSEHGPITECWAGGTVSGNYLIGGLVGEKYGPLADCYATGDVFGDYSGGLLGYSYIGPILRSYATGFITGEDYNGGLVGTGEDASYLSCFWNIEINPDVNGIGEGDDPNVIGLPTVEMQDANTYIDVGWDFNTPIWKFCSLPDYPKLAWEVCPGPEAPVLASEPNMTIGTSNTIFWTVGAEANDYYAECANDVNFTNVHDSGWIADMNYTFYGLEAGEEYWYRVKAKDASGIESDWSNIESSLQVSLGEAVGMVLDANSLENANMEDALLNKIAAAENMIEAGNYRGALNKLENDILSKTDGCAETGEPDKNDWLITCEAQDAVYPLIIETIDYVMGLMQ